VFLPDEVFYFFILFFFFLKHTLPMTAPCSVVKHPKPHVFEGSQNRNPSAPEREGMMVGACHLLRIKE
jgi:hypothetical protein